MRLALARVWLFFMRWSTVQQEPVPDRCVVIAAPHTSNWDFPVTMAMAQVKGVPIRWLGKSQMFNKVSSPIFRAMGGISVERSSPQGLVGDLADELGRHERLALIVPAEGTRTAVEYWKSGFYRIAQQAEVPIVCAFVDRKSRSGGFGPVIHPSGDIVADMDRIRAFYADKTGLKPGRFNVPRLREEDGSDLVG
jgi:1-acyl-sn-glycerol-3-phosphate acyltransferase